MFHPKFSTKLLIGFAMTLVLAYPSYSQNQVEPETKSSCCLPGQKACLHGSSQSSACQKSCAVQDYDSKDLVAPTKASIGDLTTCPVSGVVFRVTQSSPVVESPEGKVFTCCGSCEVIYNQDPKKYAPMTGRPKV